jgi:hypothetical protein
MDGQASWGVYEGDLKVFQYLASPCCIKPFRGIKDAKT